MAASTNLIPTACRTVGVTHSLKLAVREAKHQHEKATSLNYLASSKIICLVMSTSKFQ